MNPYRQAFYNNQAKWHGYQGAEDVAKRHANRARYYDWYVHGWLPETKSAQILDIGCGSGQFLYFLKSKGYTNCVGIDLDADQIQIGRQLELDCRQTDVAQFLQTETAPLDVVAMLDIIEHFTRPEIFDILNVIVSKMRHGGKLIASVPNSESPTGLRVFDADITHE